MRGQMERSGVDVTVVSRRGTATGSILDNYRYRDPDCPANDQGLWGSRFDYIELVCLLLDVGLWLLLQVWAVWRYAHMRGVLDGVDRMSIASQTSSEA